ncbi:hypothetical protein E2C01_022766 [Portunus trituberculatus]|uniref:Uncharacterized protein n=1 Tax=Portunus trituberculatus TaxID=210409 RepID=A0A5B7E848_PORTR|nr:hypothetical protein [Portunus trituberculatus]
MCKWLSGRDLCSVCGQAPPASHDVVLQECDVDLFSLLPPLPEPLKCPPCPGAPVCLRPAAREAALKDKLNLDLLNFGAPLLKSLSDLQELGPAAPLGAPHHEMIACPSAPDLTSPPEGVFLFEEGESVCVKCCPDPVPSPAPSPLPSSSIPPPSHSCMPPLSTPPRPTTTIYSLPSPPISAQYNTASRHSSLSLSIQQLKIQICLCSGVLQESA